MVQERKVSQLPELTNIAGNEYVLVGFNGVSYKTTMNALLRHFTNGVDMDVLSRIQQEIAKIPEDIDSFITLDELNQTLANFEVPGIDLSAYSTTEQIRQLLDQIEIPAGPDVSNFVTAEQVDQKISNIQFPLIPDVSHFVTEQEVDEKINNIQFPSIPDVSNFVTSTQVDEKINAIEFPAAPDVSQFVTSTQVDEKINAIEFPETPDLTGFATNTSVDEKINNISIPDVSGFATLSQVTTAVTELLQESNANKVTLADTSIGKILWVSGKTVENADGSMARPFAQIQEAIDAIPTGAAAWVILVTPKASGTGGNYLGFNTNNKQNFLVQGFGCNGAHTVVISGQVVISGAACTRARLKDIAISAPLNQEGILVDGTEGRHYFNNVTVEVAANTTAPAVRFTNGFKRWSDFFGCSISGKVVLENAGAGAVVYFNGHNSLDTQVIMNTNVSVIVRNCLQFGYIEHNEGTVEVTHVSSMGGKDGKAVLSTNPVGNVQVSFCNLLKNGTALTVEGGENVSKQLCVE